MIVPRLKKAMPVDGDTLISEIVGHSYIDRVANIPANSRCRPLPVDSNDGSCGLSGL